MNALAKSRDKAQPYATFENAQGWKWNVLKTYKQPKSEAKDQYARWFCFVTSPLCPEGEFGDTYKKDVIQFADLSSASPEFKEAYALELLK